MKLQNPYQIQCILGGNAFYRPGRRRANVSTCTSTTKSDSSQCMCFSPRSYWSSGVYMMPHSVLNSYGLLAAAMMRFEMFTVILWNRGRVMEIDGLGWKSWVISELKQPAAPDSGSDCMTRPFSLSLSIPLCLSLSHTDTGMRSVFPFICNPLLLQVIP